MFVYFLGTQIRIGNVRDPEGMHRFLFEGSFVEYTNRAAFLAAVPDTDFLVTFDTQGGQSFKDSALPMVDTNGNYPFSMQGSKDITLGGLPTGTILVPPPGFNLFGNGPFAYSVTGDGIPVVFDFANKINAFGTDIASYDQRQMNQLEVGVICPTGDLFLFPNIPIGSSFYGFVLDGAVALDIEVKTFAPYDGIYWDNVVGRFMPQDCVGCGDPHVSF